MFSPREYELASKYLGLPYPVTAAEKAAAAPVVRDVLFRMFKQPAPGPGPGGPNGDFVYTGAGRSLNSYPNVERPSIKRGFQHRLTAGPQNNEAAADETIRLLCMLMQNPATQAQAVAMIEQICNNGQEQANFLSQQAPLNYDLPSYGSSYSALNSPAGAVPPSVAFQPLS